MICKLAMQHLQFWSIFFQSKSCVVPKDIMHCDVTSMNLIYSKTKLIDVFQKTSSSQNYNLRGFTTMLYLHKPKTEYLKKVLVTE